MARHTLKLNQALRRLGIKGGEVPPVVEGLQPTILVHDVSSLVAPVLPPMAWCGGQVPNVALRRPVLEVQSNARGGTAIRFFSLTAPLSTFYNFVFSQTTLLAGALNVVTVPLFQMTPTLSGDATPLVQIGDNTPQIDSGAFGLTPLIGAAQANQTIAGQSTDRHVMYIEPGAFFYLEGFADATVINFAMLLQDYPDAHGPV